MITYFSGAHRYIKELKELKVTRFAFNEADFKKYAESKSASLTDYLSSHFDGFRRNLDFLIFKEDGSVELNKQLIPFLEYPEEYTPQGYDILVLKVPKTDSRSPGNKRSILAWCTAILAHSRDEGFSTHLANQTSPKLAMKLDQFGLTSFDINLNIDSRFKKIILPSGRRVDTKDPRAVRLYKSWCPVFAVSSKKITFGDLSEIFKFNIRSILFMFKKGVDIFESKDKLTDYKPPPIREENLPREVRELPQAFEDKDESKIISGAMRLLNEETLRYHEIRRNEKYSKTYDFNTSRIALGVVGKIVDLLKVTKPEMAGEVNQYFLDNRKIVLSAVVKEFDGVSLEERKELIKMLKQIQRERLIRRKNDSERSHNPLFDSSNCL